MASFFKTEGEKIILFGAASMLAYIPLDFFDMDIAQDYGGEHFECLGLFNVEFFSDSDATKRIGKLETLNLPTTINLYPSSSDIRDIELIKEVGVVRYQVMKFLKGEPVTDKYIIQNSKAVEGFMNLIESGKIPRTVPYDKLFGIWTTNMRLNGVAMSDVPSSSREMILAEKYRDKKNPAFRFGIKAGKDPKTSMYDYTPASARTLTKYSSTFSGFTFEDFDTMVTNGLNISKSGRKQTDSPIEPIIKY